MDELRPEWVLRLDLDGDDDPAIQTDNAESELKISLEQMEADGYIRGYSLERRQYV